MIPNHRHRLLCYRICNVVIMFVIDKWIYVSKQSVVEISSCQDLFDLFSAAKFVADRKLK